ncbi:hypothetical protein [Nonomuraea sp. NPDC003709]|uniref:hypothetical protein n=1 Tax=Nonomuraea sp. NPDC003709 TaxID=3154450 RepID=UPI0033B786CA
MLAPALGGLMLSLLESVNAGLWEDSGRGAATAILRGAPERAAGVAAGPARWETARRYRDPGGGTGSVDG